MNKLVRKQPKNLPDPATLRRVTDVFLDPATSRRVTAFSWAAQPGFVAYRGALPPSPATARPPRHPARSEAESQDPEINLSRSALPLPPSPCARPFPPSFCAERSGVAESSQAGPPTALRHLTSTQTHLARKKAEYEALWAEIKALRQDAEQTAEARSAAPN